jgi:hypothetical protein
MVKKMKVGNKPVQYIVNLPKFTGRNVPVTEIAKATQKEASYIRYGLQKGLLNFGYAFKMDGSTEFSYYCSDRKVWEETGYFRDVTDETTGE